MTETPQVWARDWTNTGGRDGVGFAQRLSELEKWMRTHRGIDYNSAGTNYPHPSQQVRALYFYDGNGRLGPAGFEILATDPANPRGFYWVDEFTDTPEIISPVTLISAYIQPAGQQLDILSRSPNGLNMAEIAYIVSDSGGQSDIRITSTGANGLNDAELIISSTTAANYVGVSVPLSLSATSSDPTLGIVDGMLWYRTDTDRFRGRANGATVSLATTADIPSVPTQFNIWPYVAKTTTYTTTATDGFIRADATSASFTITLITAVGNTGLIQVFKKIDASNNTVTIDANTTQTIDGALTYVLAVEDESVTLISDGANWQIMGSNTPVSYSAKTGNYTVILRDTFINFDCTSGALTATLPTAVGCAGHEVTIRKSDTGVNALTVDGNGSQTIGGATTYVITSPGALTIVSNGANWEIKARPASAYLAVTTTYTTTIADQVLAISAAGGAYTITLVPVAGNAGLIQTFIKTTSTNTITLDGNASETINGALSYALAARATKVSLLCTGAAWIVMNED